MKIKNLLIITLSIFTIGCRNSIFHKEGLSYALDSGVKSLGNEMRPLVEHSTESIKEYLDSLQIEDTLDKLNLLIDTTNEGGKKATELISEIKILSSTLNEKLKSDDLTELINTTKDTARNIGELSTSLKDLISLIKDKATSEEFTKLKDDVLKTASNIEALTNSLKQASQESTNTTSLTKILIWVVGGLLLILAILIGVRIIKK